MQILYACRFSFELFRNHGTKINSRHFDVNDCSPTKMCFSGSSWREGSYEGVLDVALKYCHASSVQTNL